MGSTRLPGKVLMKILNRPVLGLIVDRLRLVPEIDEVMVATSELQRDDSIQNFCEADGILVHRGREKDVLDRFYQAALSAKANTVLRVTGDCPLLDPQVVSRLIHLFRRDECDHCGIGTGAGVSNEVQINHYPDGLDTEIMSMKVLEVAWSESVTDLHREHVTPFIWQQPDRFRLGVLYPEDRDYSQFRWTLDEPEDLRLIEWIYSNLHSSNPAFGLDEVFNLYARNPEMLGDNTHLIGKEGYEVFWRNDDE